MRSRALWLLSAALLSGCLSDRLSGTEVGNPEVSVSARLGFAGIDSLAVISSLEMKVMKMEYRMPGDAMRSIWDYPDGMGVDLAAPASAANLPTVKVARGAWSMAELKLASMRGDPVLPDSLAYAAYSNPGYVKLAKKMHGDSVRFLFALPPETHLTLRFDANRLADWRSGDALSIEVMFDCAKWTSAVPDQAYQVRLDGDGRPYVVLSPSENPGVHAALEALFPECFIADLVEML